MYVVIKSVSVEKITVSYLISCIYFIHFYESDTESTSKYMDDYDRYTSECNGFWWNSVAVFYKRVRLIYYIVFT